MLKRFICIALFCLGSIQAKAQVVSISFTVTDSTTQVWNNCTWSAQLYSPNGTSYFNGTPVSTSPFSGVCNSSGVFTDSTHFFNTNSITPAGGAQYSVSICSQTSAPCSGFLATVSTSGQFGTLANNLIKPPQFTSSYGSYGYSDSEVIPISGVGSSYFNTTSASMRTWNGSSWQSGGGSGATFPSTAGVVCNTSTTASQNCIPSQIQNVLGTNIYQPVDTAYVQLVVHGDSFSAGVGASNLCPLYNYEDGSTGNDNTTNCGYAFQLGRIVNAPLMNTAFSGDQAEDQVRLVTLRDSPSYANNPVYIWDLGINDSRWGTGAGAEANYTHASTAAIAWDSIPREQKLWFGTPGSAFSTTGTWTASAYAYFQTGTAIQTIVPGSTVTFNPINTPSTIYLAWQATDGLTSSASLSCNSGAITDTLNSFGFNGQAIATFNGITSSTFATRYNIPAGITSCTVTVNTAGTGNPFTLVFEGTPTPPVPTPFANLSINQPRVYVGGVSYFPNNGGVTTEANLMAYDLIAFNIANQFKADGANVSYVNLRSTDSIPNIPIGTMNTTTDFAASNVTLANGITCIAQTATSHPDDCGHLHERDAFASAMHMLNPINYGFSQISLSSMQTLHPDGAYNGTYFGPSSVGGNGGATLYSSQSAPTSQHHTVTYVDSQGDYHLAAANDNIGGPIDYFNCTRSGNTPLSCSFLTPLSESFSTSKVGTSIASATTIAPVAGVTHITGTTAIASITPLTTMSSTIGGCITLIADGAWTTTTAGNISAVMTAVPNTQYSACYDGTTWRIK